MTAPVINISMKENADNIAFGTPCYLIMVNLKFSIFCFPICVSGWMNTRLMDFALTALPVCFIINHGLGYAFSGYDDYFGGEVDEQAIAYLTLANKLIHEVRPDAVTVAEDVSGMPGLAAPLEHSGCGFDYRLAMGITDYWFKLFDKADEDWNMYGLWHELTNRRSDEKTVSYVECHDQSIVGGQLRFFA